MWSKTCQAYAIVTYLEESSLSLDIETRLVCTAWALINFEHQLPFRFLTRCTAYLREKNDLFWLYTPCNYTSPWHLFRTVVCHSCFFYQHHSNLSACMKKRVLTTSLWFSCTLSVHTHTLQGNNLRLILQGQCCHSQHWVQIILKSEISNLDALWITYLLSLRKLVAAIARIDKWEQMYSIYQETRNNRLQTSILCSYNVVRLSPVM